MSNHEYQSYSGRLMLFDAHESTFRNVRLRPKNPNCSICRNNPEITKLLDYEQFCGSKANDKNPNLKLLKNHERISVKEYRDIRDSPHLLIDVRSPEEFEICSLEGANKIPYTKIQSNNGIERTKMIINEKIKEDNSNVYIICRRGNDSQKVASLLKDALNDKTNRIKDIIGGIHAWTRGIDPTFPIY